MSLIEAAVEGIGLLGPGLSSWPQAEAVLAGALPYESRRSVLPPPAALPPAERRRAGATIRSTLAAGAEAVAASGLPAAELDSVFTSSSGDGVNCHELCVALAAGERMVSPTRFHNSVHNAASGYWSIATGAKTASAVLCVYDGSFVAGLLEAMVQTAMQRRPLILFAYDTPYPEPLHSVRPLPDDFCVALVLAPSPSAPTVAMLRFDPAAMFSQAAAEAMGEPALETLRQAIPAARVLPLLAAIAQRQAKRIVLDYLPAQRLELRVGFGPASGANGS